jgi:hypothetical protein
MVKIVNEIPDELKDDESMEVDLTPQDKEDYEEAVEAKKEEAAPKQELDFEIEEEDDTPPQDRNREPLPDNIKQELEEDNLEEYSDRVKQRMAQLKKAWHDERRAKEAEAREREEAIKYAQHIINENNRLKTTLSAGEEDYLKTLKTSFESELAIAKRDYREAYDSGDAEKISEAQTKISEAQYKLMQAQQLKPKFTKEALQEEQNSRQYEQARLFQPKTAQPDEKALNWQAKNTWFGKNKVMTATALGLHDELLSEGINPTSDIYYRRIDNTMHKLFPEHFGETESLEGQPAQRTTKPSTVVAPATRSTAPKKVRLTKTQLALAKKFKLTPEQYARELLKTENANG